MDADQRTLENPLGMDEACRNCPALCDARERVVHGYGDVGADFVFVGETPDAGAEDAGVPFAGSGLWPVLRELGFAPGPDGAAGDEPDASRFGLENAYLTYLARCRHPGRPPTDAEVGNCDPYLNAEIRSINPEIIVPVGGRALGAVAADHTTRPPDSFDAERDHAREIRGRGFELVPTVDPAVWTDEQRAAFVGAMGDLLGRDYRQTKGRRGREERERSGR